MGMQLQVIMDSASSPKHDTFAQLIGDRIQSNTHVPRVSVTFTNLSSPIPIHWRDVCLSGSRMKHANTTKTKTAKLSLTLLVVKHLNARYMAYRDAAGRLRDFWSNRLLPLPLHILDPES